ncbi:metal ABC transporter permease [Blastococcus sp. Marseille-P5729]|uniref:metal ABC transporter permease n=1 Tax=Blastococcus sp. Marseille-P5729 TaxID=2086582 RepID=UPI000D0FBB50|nr:metal ABC transporter permease [Blastococcus sp. Marseille-P5729]
MSTALSLSVLEMPFMQRALIAAVLVGICAPAVGIYIVQRKMSLLGDGIGHIAFAGVGLGVLTGTSPVLMAVIVSVIGAILTELVRARAKTSGDLALAILFYGGIAAGALMISMQSGGSNISVQSFLFGSILTVNRADLVIISVLAVLVVLVTIGMRRVLLAVSHDDEFARVGGVPVSWVNVLIAVTAALTVSVAMRVVGLLLVSALMVLPVAASSQLARSFTATQVGSIAFGVVVAVAGVLLSYPMNVGPGSLIVVLAIGLFFVSAVVGRLVSRT